MRSAVNVSARQSADDARRYPSGELDHEISPSLADALLSSKNIRPDRLYSHQAAAINALHPSAEHPRGQNVIISTSTSSGKSLIYQLPVAQALEEDSDTTALYVFPTKALAQDQKRALGELVGGVEGLEGVKIATFDGDTPRDDRDYIRDNANVVRPSPPLPRPRAYHAQFAHLDLTVPDLYEPRHAAHHDLAARRALATLLPQAPLCRRRRAPHLLGPVRLSRRFRHASVRPLSKLPVSRARADTRVGCDASAQRSGIATSASFPARRRLRTLSRCVCSSFLARRT